MRFTQIKLHNFGIYSGTHTLIFDRDTGDKNIVLIGGMNGRGKTTILEAIFIALYGNRATTAIQDRKMNTYSKILNSRFNKNAEDTIAYVEVSFLMDDKGKQELLIHRSWKLSDKRKSTIDELEVRVNGQLDSVLAQNWNFYVEEILPLSIARFFFFDNEQISEIAEEESFERIKNSIKAIMGITTIDTLQADLTKLLKDKTSQLTRTENSQFKSDYETVTKETEKIRKNIEEENKKQRKLESDIFILNGKINKLENSFWEKGGYLGTKHDSLKEKQEQCISKMNEVMSKIEHVIMDAKTPLFLCGDLLKRTLLTCEKNEEIMMQKKSNRIVQEIRKKLFDRVMETFHNTETCNVILDLLDKEFSTYEQTDVDDNYYMISSLSYNLLQRLCENDIKDIFNICIDLLDEYTDIDEELIRLKSHLNNEIDEIESKVLYQEIKGVEEEKTAKELELKYIEKEIFNLNTRLRELSKKETELFSQIAEIETQEIETTRIVKYANNTLKIMDEFKLRLQRRKVERLEENITHCFQYLVGKQNMVKRVNIEAESLNIMLIGTDGGELLKSQLSAGEKQIFAISVLWGLALSSGYQVPIVIDTPMGRLDSVHRKNFVKKYLPKASSQVIVLSTDEEIYGEYLAYVEPYVSKFYTLQYDEENEKSTIIEGYFGEKVCL